MFRVSLSRVLHVDPLTARSWSRAALRSPVHLQTSPSRPLSAMPRTRPALLQAARRGIRLVCGEKLGAVCQRIPPTQLARLVASSSGSHSEDGKLIYTGNLGKAVLGVKFFSYSTSMFSVCVMPYVLMKTGLGVQSFALQVAFCGVIGFFTFLTPVLLHFITKGYVVRLYHKEEKDTYTAVTYSPLLLERKTVFHQSDVTIPDVSRMFTSFYAKNRSMLVNPMLFPLPHDYNHLMGYDRPFSFDIDELNKPDKS
ncbi:transmembrane protein 70, mitochondrial [Denticeps clupeoides]|uniref:Transmembrane protein 70 n=1 Tax=Denticeps clupeoides TaxID=299321 RepID=A0AAY4A738_9TELE|nr:transmembrane protein 70, mitochondrial [Denticeps clupeoides]